VILLSRWVGFPVNGEKAKEKFRKKKRIKEINETLDDYP